MAQEQNPVVHQNAPMPSVTKATDAIGNRKANGARYMKGVTKQVNKIGGK